MLVRHADGDVSRDRVTRHDRGRRRRPMAANDIGVVPITHGERLIGIVTDRDLALRVLAERKDPNAVRLGEIATTQGIETTSPDAQLCDARALMAERRIRRLPVVED